MSEEGKERAGGPVPVRDLMRGPQAGGEAGDGPRWEGEGHAFEHDGVGWSARPAGVGSYGTGDLGTARLLAVHFYRDDQPDHPVREALVPAASFPGLREEELGVLLERATPIELDRDQTGASRSRADTNR